MIKKIVLCSTDVSLKSFSSETDIRSNTQLLKCVTSAFCGHHSMHTQFLILFNFPLGHFRYFN